MRLLPATAAVALLAASGSASAAEPAGHEVRAACRYDGVQVVAVAVATATQHADVPTLTLTCEIGAGAINATFTTTVTSNAAHLAATATGYPRFACASAYAVWPDGHTATYSESCLE